MQAEIRQASLDTASFQGLTVNLAINYGGRDEIVRSLRRCLADGIAEPNEANISSHLDEPDIPDADLIIEGVRNHMAQWNKPASTPPQNPLEQIVSYADYLASRDDVYVQWRGSSLHQ